MPTFFRRFSNIEILKSVSKTSLFNPLPKHHGPARDAPPVLTKLLRQVVAPSDESNLTSRGAILSERRSARGHLTCQSFWRNLPLISVQTEANANG
jgi:hypothetical protein